MSPGIPLQTRLPRLPWSFVSWGQQVMRCWRWSYSVLLSCRLPLEYPQPRDASVIVEQDRRIVLPPVLECFIGSARSTKTGPKGPESYYGSQSPKSSRHTVVIGIIPVELVNGAIAYDMPPFVKHGAIGLTPSCSTAPVTAFGILGVFLPGLFTN